MLTVLLHRAVMGMGPTLLGVLCCNVVSLSLAFKIKKNFFFLWGGGGGRRDRQGSSFCCFVGGYLGLIRLESNQEWSLAVPSCLRLGSFTCVHGK